MAEDLQPDKKVPPPAKLPPGVTGNPPLPTGRAVTRTFVPKKPSADERKVLEEGGWKDGDPVPTDLPKRIAAAVEAAQAEIQAATATLPVDPGTPPVEFDPDAIPDISKVDQARQAAVRQALAEAAGTAAAPQISQAMPHVAQTVMAADELPPPAAVAAAPTSVASPQAAPQTPPVAVRTEVASASIGAASPSPNHAAPTPDQVTTSIDDAAATQPDAVVTPSTEDAGAKVGRTRCQHCDWDLTVPDPVEPDDDEKLAFLQSIIGAKPFMKEYPLMGGQMKIWFRTLAPGEIDVLFQEVYKERDEGKVTNEVDFYERLARLRLYMQTVKIQASSFEGGILVLPGGLSPESNPNAGTYWDGLDAERPLLSVEKFMVAQVTTNESRARIVQIQCGRFNQLVNKLEVMVDNPSFWPAPVQRA